MTTPHDDDLVTVGELARELRLPKHRVAYIVDSRQIPHVKRAGVLRMFRRKGTLKVLRQALASIEARRIKPVPA